MATQRQRKLRGRFGGTFVNEKTPPDTSEFRVSGRHGGIYLNSTAVATSGPALTVPQIISHFKQTDPNPIRLM